jgi:UDP-N-acetylmuramyl pentapeptide phosphotransferase/UDP-N-acetylglucosamine-1-phosphate transferase
MAAVVPLIIGLTNAFNFMDGSTVLPLAPPPLSFFFLVITFSLGAASSTFTATPLAGALGFAYNFPPARSHG